MKEITIEQEAKVTVYRHRVHYYETDQMGVVHHSNYIRWFEEARIFFMEQMNVSYRQMEESGISIPVLSVSCEYKTPTRFGDEVDIIPSILSFNGIKMTIGYRIEDAVTHELRVVGETGHCFVNHDFKPVTLKKADPEVFRIFSACLDGN